MKKALKENGKWILIGLFILILDQLTKIYFKYKNIDFKFFAFTYVENTGISFGMLQGTTLFIGILGLVVFLLLIYYQDSFREYPLVLGLLIGGVLGNTLDRLIRGYVIDFIDFKIWPVFNIADAAIFFAVIIVLIKTIQKSSKSWSWSK